MPGFDDLGGAWPLIGRGAALDRFAAMLDDDELRRGEPAAGLAIIGVAGLGKSRLAAACLGLAADRGWRTEQIVGTTGAVSIPFAAVTGLIGDEPDPGFDAAAIIGRVSRALTEAGPLCLAVDDLALLDDASVTLVQQLAGTPGVLVVVTARPDQPRAQSLLGWLTRNGSMARIDLAALEPAEVLELAATVLGRPLAAPAAQWLCETSGGNPLFVRELLLAAAEEGGLRIDGSGGTIHLTHPPRASKRLAEVVAGRLGALDETEQRCLETVAVAEPVTFDVIARLGLDEAVARLERRRIVVARRAGTQIELMVAHPLYAEVARDRIRPLRLRTLRRALAAATESSTERRAGDAARIAAWKLDSGLRDSTRNLIAAAKEARIAGDVEDAVRFARAAHETEPSVDSALVLGEALFRMRAAAETEDVLAAASTWPGDDRTRARIAIVRARNLFWLLGRRQLGITVLDDASASIVDPDQRRAVRDEAAELRVSAADGQATDPAGTTRLRALTLMVRGRNEDALALLRDASVVDGVIDLEIAGLEAFATVEAGRLGDGRARAERLIASGAGTRPDADGWALLAVGSVHLSEGNGVAALATFRRAIERFDRQSDPLPISLGTSRAVISMLTIGDLDDARALMSSVPAHTRDAIFAEQLDSAEAAVLIAAGRADDAAVVLRRRIAIAANDGLAGAEHRRLHDLVRFGLATEDERRRIVELGVLVDGPLAELRTRHAAIAGNGPAAGAEFAALAADVEAAGYLVWAHQLATRAVSLLTGPSNERARAAELRRVARLRNEFPRSLLRAPSPERGTTRRLALRPGEHQVAVLAATGHSDREIADQLHLSIRTVGNYLQRTYRRLGISGRDHLADALAEL